MKWLLDRIVPAGALYWGPEAHMTKCWPWVDANPAIGERINPDVVWDLARWYIEGER